MCFYQTKLMEVSYFGTPINKRHLCKHKKGQRKEKNRTLRKHPVFPVVNQWVFMTIFFLQQT